MPSKAKKVFEGKIYSIWQWNQRLYDGTETVFERLKRRDTVHTIGVLEDGKILLALDEQPDRGPVITPAGGQIDPGETPEEAAKREFREELSYEIGELVPWHTYQPSGKIDWTVYAFVGRQLSPVSGVHPEAGEKIQPLLFTFEEFLQLGSDARLRDYLLRIILLEAQLDRKRRMALEKILYGGT